MYRTVYIKALALILVVVDCVGSVCADEQAVNFTPSEACIKVLRSNCNATQEVLLDELLQKLDIHGIGDQAKQYPGKPPAFEALPKDELGYVNWIRAVTDGVIKPRGTLDGKEQEPYEGFLHNLMFLQVEAHLMADVVFPHGMHTYWLSCESCHPEPFKEKRGSNNITMKGISQGKWCGKCHGKVAFPVGDYSNCRRCHVMPKKMN